VRTKIRDSSGRTQNVRRRSSRRLGKGRPRRGRLPGLSAVVSQVVRFARPLMALIALLIIMVAYNRVTGSELFELHHVQVSGIDSLQLQSEIEQTVRKTVGSTRLLDIELAGIRQKIEAMPRVRSAWVMRALPDSIRVEAAERQATVLARRDDGALAWLDSDAVEIGDVSSVKLPSGIPPVAKGFSEGARTQLAIADDRERIAVYNQLQEELSIEPGAIWTLIDQIDLSLPKDVTIHLARPAVRIHLGSREFRNRTETALKILDGIKRHDVDMLNRLGVQDGEALIRNPDGITYIDVVRPDRIVLIPAAPEAAKDTKQDSQARNAPGKKH